MTDPMNVYPTPEQKQHQEQELDDSRKMPMPEPLPKAAEPDFELPELPPGLTPNQKVAILSMHGEKPTTYGPKQQGSKQAKSKKQE